jgi:hypothetical protein
MQDIAAKWLRELSVGGWTPFGNITSALYSVTDVHTFVCVTRLDGDRRFESRYSRKIPFPAHSFHHGSLCAQRTKRCHGC